ncbi:hypothetical protein HanPSC8_Chr16g0697331 [Helianthus annuus]|nr:hypothetical protein HanPSC8_Chr16g0697331 [Helianthus annuus]
MPIPIPLLLCLFQQYKLTNRSALITSLSRVTPILSSFWILSNTSTKSSLRPPSSAFDWLLSRSSTIPSKNSPISLATRSTFALNPLNLSTHAS